MSNPFLLHKKQSIFGLAVVFALGILSIRAKSSYSVLAQSDHSQENTTEENGADLRVQISSHNAYLPVVSSWYPWLSPFGVESERVLTSNSDLYNHVANLNVGWVRLNDRISWRKLQPNEGDPIHWDLLASFENEIKALISTGLTPIVIVDDYPRWATDNSVRDDGQPTSCGPVLNEKFTAFADFMRSIVARYKTPEFNVHHWELGNEPDIDPNRVFLDNVFGCWGDIDDPLYGGQHYGEMLIEVGNAIRKEDPTAQIWIGGLLLANPNTTNLMDGKSELFLKGILESGASPYFDIVPFHWYPPYLNQKVDHDNQLPGSSWMAMGGGVIGKANYLRQLMAQYGVSKPLYLNETSLMCPPFIGGVKTTWCDPPSSDFYQMQADHLVRTFVRGFSVDIKGFSWYSLNGPGWNNVGLLDEYNVPRPAYTAFQFLGSRLQNSHYVGPRDYGSGLDAYAFKAGNQNIVVVWARKNEVLSMPVPGLYVEVYDRDGNLIVLQSGLVDVGFSPVYIIENSR